MALGNVPTGLLVSFGSLVFSGAGTPANVSTSTSSVETAPEKDRPRKAHPTNPYGVSLRGYSPGVWKPFSYTWTITAVATPGLSTAASWQAVEGAKNTWLSAWQGTHTHRGTAGTPGELGDLVAKDTFGTSWTCEAELFKFPYTWKPGEVTILQIVLEFWPLGDWA